MARRELFSLLSVIVSRDSKGLSEKGQQMINIHMTDKDRKASANAHLERGGKAENWGTLKILKKDGYGERICLYLSEFTIREIHSVLSEVIATFDGAPVKIECDHCDESFDIDTLYNVEYTDNLTNVLCEECLDQAEGVVTATRHVEA